jgi:hypothetical protein
MPRYETLPTLAKVSAGLKAAKAALGCCLLSGTAILAPQNVFCCEDRSLPGASISLISKQARVPGWHVCHAIRAAPRPLHARAGNARWCCAIVFAVVGTVGALAGSTLGKLVHGDRLLFLFGLFMLAVGVAMLRPQKTGARLERPADLKTCLLTATVSLTTGIASGFFGIGSGFLIGPSLLLGIRRSNH